MNRLSTIAQMSEAQLYLSMIDLRSDVVTRAPKEMLQAMSEAQCENDAALDDFETIRFEERLAKMFNKEAAIFFLTSSMSSLAAVILHTRPGSQVIISSTAHSVERESASFARVAGVQTRQIFTETGMFSPQQIKERIRKSSQHVTFPDTDLIFLENGTFRGRVWDLHTLREIKKIAEESKVAVHIDGARIFNALDTYGLEAKDISDCYDTMSLCFTKALCCPIGGAIIGSAHHIKRLKNIRKSLGGGLLHTGIISNGIEYALDHLLPEVKRDNQMAKLLAKGLSSIAGVRVSVQETQTNLVYWSIGVEGFDHAAFFDYLLKEDIRIKVYDQDAGLYRFVTHLHVRNAEVEKVVSVVGAYFNAHHHS